jgi:UDP-glucose 4-epimerase
LRYSNVYGPRQIAKSEAGVISIFINQLLQNDICSIFGDGNQTRDYVYVKDVVNANSIALNCPAGIYNIGTGIETSVNNLLDILEKIIGHGIEHKNEPPRPGEVRRNALDPSMAKEKINWRPTVSLSQGIGETYQYFNQYYGKNQLS